LISDWRLVLFLLVAMWIQVKKWSVMWCTFGKSRKTKEKLGKFSCHSLTTQQPQTKRCCVYKITSQIQFIVVVPKFLLMFWNVHLQKRIV
jgi:RNA 3'-terminal phosphate cyclase